MEKYEIKALTKNIPELKRDIEAIIAEIINKK